MTQSPFGQGARAVRALGPGEGRMNKLWIVAGVAIMAAAVGLVVTPGCASDPCEELGDMCSSCPHDAYRAQCEQAAASGNETVCQSQVNAFDAYCNSGIDGGLPEGGPSCEPGEVSCPPGVCTSLATDPDHCGNCGTACDVAEVCALGSCADSCPEPLQPCEGGCVNVRADPDHCGSCGNACAEGQVCSEGSCADECESAVEGLYPTECAGGCVNLSTDPLHCGACGAACLPGQVCSLGACQGSCGDGLTYCCGLCVNTMTHPEHCGGCDPITCPSGAGGAGGAAGTGGVGGAGGAAGGAGGAGGAAPTAGACTAGQACFRGQCVDGCGPFAECGGACVEVSSDPFNCGICGNVCADGDVCTDAACASSCEPGETDCFGSCVDTDSSAAHCGACGNACTATQVCSQGSCLSDCADGLEECPLLSGNCVDTQTNPEFCGDCDTACGDPTPLCSSGSCVSGCGTGETNCNGACVDLNTDFNNCGACGNSCNDQSVCTADSCDGQGECQNDSGVLVCNDGNQCTMDLCDPVTGCYSQELSRQQVEQLCGGGSQDTCVFCDPEGASCNVVPRDDGIDCTDDVCPDNAVYSPSAIHVPNDANCPTSCAPTCDPVSHTTLPGSTDSHGCFKNQGACTATCHAGCDPDHPLADTTDDMTGCVENSSVCTSNPACSPYTEDTCDPESTNPVPDSCGCIDPP